MPTFLAPVGVTGPAANGPATIGTNTTTSAGGLWFGTDSNLYRLSANILKIDGGLALGSFGTNPALSGALRLPNEGVVKGRNVGNTVDLDLIKVGADNSVYVSSASAVSTVVANNVITGGTLQVNGASASIGPNPSATGGLRLPAGVNVSWRNFANTGDIVGIDASPNSQDNIEYTAGTGVSSAHNFYTGPGSGLKMQITQYGYALYGDAYISSALTVGASAATSGNIRLPSGGSIAWRNAANGADWGLLQYDTSNNMVLRNSLGSGLFLDCGTSGLYVRNTAFVAQLTVSDAGAFTFRDGATFALGTTTGTKIGTAITEKIGFWNATPVVQPANTVAIDTVLSTLGLRAAGGTANFASSLTLSSAAPQISLTNATSNWITMSSAGAAPPSFATRSTGTKLVLFDALAAGATDYAIGIDSGTIWQSVPSTSGLYKWYGGTTLAATLAGTGNLTLVGTAAVGKNITLPVASGATSGNLFFIGDTSAGVDGMRMFSAGNNSYIDVNTTAAAEGLIFRVDTTVGGSERLRIRADGDVLIGYTQIGTSGTWMSIGNNPSTQGTLRLPNQNSVQWRNAANTLDTGYIYYSNLNVLSFVGDSLYFGATNNSITFSSLATTFSGTIAATGVYGSLASFTGPGQFTYAAATSSTTYAGSYFSTPKNTVTLFLGDQLPTSAYTANEFSSDIRWNGGSVAWGDIGYYPTGGDAGEYGHFRFSLAGAGVVTTPNAKLGMGDLYVASEIGVATLDPLTKLHVAGSTEPTSELGSLMLSGSATVAKRLTFGFSDTYNAGWIASIHTGVLWLNTMINPVSGNVLVGTTVSTTLLSVGTNTTTAAGGLSFGTDTNLYRSAANTLSTDDSLYVAGNLTVPGAVQGGTLQSLGPMYMPNGTYLYGRNAANNAWLGMIVKAVDDNTYVTGQPGGFVALGQVAGAEWFRASAAGSSVFGAYVAIGTNPAASGALRLPSSGYINWRNAANNADLTGIAFDGTNVMYVASSSNAVVIGNNMTINSGAGIVTTVNDIYARSGNAGQIGIGALGPAAQPSINFGTSTDSRIYRLSSALLNTDADWRAQRLGAGTSPDPNFLLHVAGVHPGTGTAPYGLVVQATMPATATVSGVAGYFQMRTNAAAFTMASAYGVYVANLFKGAGSAVTTNYGMLIEPISGGASNNFGLVVGHAGSNTLWLANDANGTTAAGGIVFGSSRDTNLYRSATDTLRTDDTFFVAGASLTFGAGTYLNQPSATGGQWLLGTKVAADTTYRWYVEGDTGKLWWGAGGVTAADTNLYRSSAAVLRTDSNFYVGNGAADRSLVVTGTGAGANDITLTASSGGPGITFGSYGSLVAQNGKTGLVSVSGRPVAVAFTSSTFDIMSGGMAGTKAAEFGASYLAIGTNPSTTGALRLPNNQRVAWRSAANNQDIAFLYADATDRLLIDCNIGLTVYAATLIGDANNVSFGTVWGTKLGTATGQKIGFWNTAPVVQPTTAVASSTVVLNGASMGVATTFDGYTLAQVVKALRNIGILQ